MDKIQVLIEEHQHCCPKGDCESADDGDGETFPIARDTTGRQAWIYVQDMVNQIGLRSQISSWVGPGRDRAVIGRPSAKAPPLF